MVEIYDPANAWHHHDLLRLCKALPNTDATAEPRRTERTGGAYVSDVDGVDHDRDESSLREHLRGRRDCSGLADSLPSYSTCGLHTDSLCHCQRNALQLLLRCTSQAVCDTPSNYGVVCCSSRCATAH